jgi:hypothetical protein
MHQSRITKTLRGHPFLLLPRPLRTVNPSARRNIALTSLINLLICPSALKVLRLLSNRPSNSRISNNHRRPANPCLILYLLSTIYLLHPRRNLFPLNPLAFPVDLRTLLPGHLVPIPSVNLSTTCSNILQEDSRRRQPLNHLCHSLLRPMKLF